MTWQFEREGKILAFPAFQQGPTQVLQSRTPTKGQSFITHDDGDDDDDDDDHDEDEGACAHIPPSRRHIMFVSHVNGRRGKCFFDSFGWLTRPARLAGLQGWPDVP